VIACCFFFLLNKLFHDSITSSDRLCFHCHLFHQVGGNQGRGGGDYS